MGTPIIDALRQAAADNPEAAAELVADLRAQFDALSPEDQAAAVAELKATVEELASLPEEDREAIAYAIRDYTSTPIINAMRDAAAANPEAAEAMMADLRAQFDQLDPAEQADVMAGFQALAEDAANLPLEQREMIAQSIRDRWGV